MKRTNSNGNLPPTPVITNLSDRDAASRETPVKKSLAPYLAADVQQRARALASERECISGEAKLAMRTPNVHVLDEERPHFFSLPDDVFAQIIPRLNQKAIVSMAASCRLGFFHADRLHPMRRLPGLLNDLKRLRVGNLSIDPDSFKAFLEAISLGGDYDRALLTPLSPALRSAVTVATQTWGGNRLSARNRIKSNTLIIEFLKTNYDPNFESGVKQVLEWQLERDENRICSVAPHWANFFANATLSLELRSRIFETLIDFLFVAKTKLFRPESLSKIAMENSLTLNFLSVGVLALLNPKSNFLFSQINQKLADLKESDPTRELLLMIDCTLRHNRSVPSNERTRLCAIFLKMLDVITEFPDKNIELVLLKMIAVLKKFSLFGLGGHELTDIVFSGPYAFSQSLRKEFDEKAAALPGVPAAGAIFACSLVDRISKLQNADLVQSLMHKVSIVMQESFSLTPQFAEYMERKIAGLR